MSEREWGQQMMDMMKDAHIKGDVYHTGKYLAIQVAELMRLGMYSLSGGYTTPEFMGCVARVYIDDTIWLEQQEETFDYSDFADFRGLKPQERLDVLQRGNIVHG